jgi:hypothetical protein
MAESDLHHRRLKNENPAQRNLDERQILRLHAQTEQYFKRVPECIHRIRVYRWKKLCRAHADLEEAASQRNT